MQLPQQTDPAPYGPGEAAPAVGHGRSHHRLTDPLVPALYFFRAVFSVTWGPGLRVRPVGGTPGVLAGFLLVYYPVSGAVAMGMAFEPTARPGPDGRIRSTWRLAAGAAAAGGILITLLASLAATITVFGVWAIVTGTIMADLVVRRRRALGGQGLMTISGAGSVFAGITFIGWMGTPRQG